MSGRRITTTPRRIPAHPGRRHTDITEVDRRGGPTERRIAAERRAHVFGPFEDDPIPGSPAAGQRTRFIARRSIDAAKSTPAPHR